MSKAEIAALEKVFAAEVEGRLPFQSKAAIYKRLRDGGLIEDMKVSFAGTGWVKVTVNGYQLTQAGRLMYCRSCRQPAE